MSIYKGSQLISGAMPNSANQSLSNLDSTGQAVIDGKVSKAGDTMTGDLTIDTNTNTPHILLQSNIFDYTTTVAPANAISVGSIGIRDKNENNVSLLQTMQSTSSAVETRLYVFRNINGTSYSGMFRVGIDSNGVASCSFPNTTCCDGQWISSYQEAIGSTAQTINAQATKDITFSNLPAKKCEILFTISQSTDIELAIFSNLIGTGVNRALKKGCVSMILPVSSDKKIRITNLSTSATASISIVRLMGYRVLGTNTNT